jgi:mono/diheme cytochrome c family protein
MNYPFWDQPFGYGLLMAAMAVLHVFVSHFAIGGGLYLVITEQRARKHNDRPTLLYLEKLSKFFALTTLVFGAVTGVGIWFIIGLLNPAATELLIHNFVWGWATEWTFFVVEIAAALIYFYSWRTMSARNHLVIGWIYFVTAWLSLVVINGILAFMLTPGNWLQSGSFWAGFLNPTYFSSLFFRTGVCILLAGLFGMLITSRLKDIDLRGRITRYNAGWGLIGLLIMAPTFYWYWQTIPAAVLTAAQQAMPTPIAALTGSFWNAGILAFLLVLFGLLLPRRNHVVIAVLMLGVGLSYFGEFEWFRESIRKPWIISGYMYGNGLKVSDLPTYQADGLLPHIAFRSDNPGKDLFNRACRTCHTIDGYKPLRPAFDGTDKAYVAGMVMGTAALKGNMPPFAGTPADAELIAEYIWSKVDQRPLWEISGLRGAALGKLVFDLRCGRCHEMGGFNDKYASLVGLQREDYESILEMADDLGEAMPAFTGDVTEREALIDYLLTLGNEQTTGGSNAGL